MKSLLERLRPEKVEMLESIKTTRPLTYDKVKRALKFQEYVHELTLDQANGICATLDCELLNIYELFNI